MTAVGLSAAELVDHAVRIGEEIAGPASGEVDKASRFPVEAIEALREAGLLAALVPRDFGGAGAGLATVAEVVVALGRHCASTAMVYAMHQIQVACLARHGRDGLLGEELSRVASAGTLLASATTEVGVGGDVRTSICAVETGDGRFRLDKQAPVISYGEEAQAVLATARRSPDSPPSDQVIVFCPRDGLTLDRTGDWDALGFRGTCSLGFVLRAEGPEELVFTEPYADISARTMLPVSHVLWGAVWLGLATSALDRARHFIRSGARKNPGVTPPAAVHMAELVGIHQQMSELVRGGARRFDEHCDDPDILTGMGFAISMNALKVSASTLVVDIVGRAMTICGIAGYREDTPYSLGRHLRDAYGAALMVNNDRINANTAQMLLIHREGRS